MCCAVLVCVAVGARADQKIKKRMSMGDNAFDSTSYVKGERSRDEMNFGPMQMVTIHQCDTGKTITLNDRNRTYMVMSDSGSSSPAPRAATKGSAPKQQAPEPEEAQGPARKGGIITITTNVTDTGERKQMFGYTARHVKASMQYESSPDACNPGSGKIDMDGWYIDFSEGSHSCVRPERQLFEGGPMGGGGGRQRKPDCQDQIKYSGPGITAMTKLGYPADVTTLMTDKEGKSVSMRQQALEISKATLAPSLFDAPAGYTEAKSYAQLMGMGSIGDMMRSAATARAGGNVSRAPVGTPEVKSRGANVSRGAVGTGEIKAKVPGTVRVGVVLVQDKTGSSLNGEDLRRALISNLTRFNLDSVPVDGDDDTALTSDCKQKQCDYILYTDVTGMKAPSAVKKAAGGMFGRALGGMVDRRTGVGGSAGESAGNAAAGGTFESATAYRLFRINNTSNAALQANGAGKGQAADQSVMPTFDRESRDVMTQVQKDKMAQ